MVVWKLTFDQLGQSSLGAFQRVLPRFLHYRPLYPLARLEQIGPLSSLLGRISFPLVRVWREASRQKTGTDVEELLKLMGGTEISDSS
jgi:hypothetical protein